MKTGNLTLSTFQLAAVLTISLFAISTTFFAQSTPKPNDGDKKPATDSQFDTKQIQIDLDKATAFNLPRLRKSLTAVSFNTPDGKHGWVMRIPGSRPIATPAYANGMIFAGGGYGSHLVFAIDAPTGRVLLQMKNNDDGPPTGRADKGHGPSTTASSDR